MPQQPRIEHEADTTALAPDVDPRARRWIVRKFGTKVLAEIGRLRKDSRYATTDVRDLIAIAYEAVAAPEIRSREAAALLRCDSSAMRDFSDRGAADELLRRRDK